MRILSDMLKGVKVIKYFAWELAFYEKLLLIRRKEIAILKRVNLVQALNILAASFTPMLVSLSL